MGILSGFEKYKRHLKIDDENYKLVSEWTHADTVEMSDGKSLSESITELTQNTDEKITELVQDVDNKFTEAVSNMYYDQNENILYIKLSDGTLFPFINDCTSKLIYEDGTVYYQTISLYNGASSEERYISMNKSGNEEGGVADIRTHPIDVTKYNKISIKYSYGNKISLLDADISDITDSYYIGIQVIFSTYTTTINLILFEEVGKDPLLIGSLQLDEPYNPIRIHRIKLLYNIV